MFKRLRQFMIDLVNPVTSCVVAAKPPTKGFTVAQELHGFSDSPVGNPKPKAKTLSKVPTNKWVISRGLKVRRLGTVTKLATDMLFVSKHSAEVYRNILRERGDASAEV